MVTIYSLGASFLITPTSIHQIDMILARVCSTAPFVAGAVAGKNSSAWYLMADGSSKVEPHLRVYRV